ncbi:tripartite motif-containing protein 2-like [Mytilus californianus]|uniref:tripartite motif-containing protein 2-like n=1 Tax=Mytilus californianus TaxID=6549 RepID=UPI002245A2FD|nr:tripartite motif-containing protein 2-like [Mytilus californianus]
MEKIEEKQVMEVYSTDVEQKSIFSSNPRFKEKRSLSFNLLPFRLKQKSKSKRCLSSSDITKIEEHISEPESDKVMLSDDFSTSSSEDEDSECGYVNISFEKEVNGHALLYKTFGCHGTRDGNLKDGSDISYMSQGRCVVADLLNCRLSIFSKSGRNTLTIQNEDTIEPWGVTVHEDIVLVTSRRKRLVLKMSQTGDYEESSFGDSLFQDPCGIATTKDHRIIITDIQSMKVSIHDWSGKWLDDICLPDNHGLQFKTPRYVTVSPLGDIIVSDSGNHQIYIFSSNGNFKKTFGCYGSNDGQLKVPYGICCDKFGNIFVADHYNDRISFFSKDGEFVRQIITKHDGIFHPQGISISPDMKLFITHGSLKAREVKVFNLISKSKVTDVIPVFHL